VSWEMRVAGEPKFPDSQDLPDFPYSKFAELVGLKGIAVSDPSGVGAAWDDAFGSRRPVVLEARTDPDVATIPPHISIEQAKGIASTIVKGDPAGIGVVRQALKDIAAKFLQKPSQP